MTHGWQVGNIVSNIAPGADINYINNADTNGVPNTFILDQTTILNDYDLVNLSFGDRIPESTLTAVGLSSLATISQVQTALTDAGVSIAPRGDALQVIAAGNEYSACSQITTCNRVAITAALRNENFIVTGSLAADGISLEDYSNRAGILANNFIAAHEGNLNLDGTSFAAPTVTGVAALIMDKWDNTDAQNTMDIIFDTADDLGAPGTDNVFGRGALNVGAALSPVGTLR